MNGRELALFALGAAAFGAEAQTAGKVPRIGFLGNSTAALEADLDVGGQYRRSM